MPARDGSVSVIFNRFTVVLPYVLRYTRVKYPGKYPYPTLRYWPRYVTQVLSTLSTDHDPLPKL